MEIEQLREIIGIIRAFGKNVEPLLSEVSGFEGSLSEEDEELISNAWSSLLSLVTVAYPNTALLTDVFTELIVATYALGLKRGAGE